MPERSDDVDPLRHAVAEFEPQHLLRQAWNVASTITAWYPKLWLAHRAPANLLEVRDDHDTPVVAFGTDAITIRTGAGQDRFDWRDVCAAPVATAGADAFATAAGLSGARRTGYPANRPMTYEVVAAALARVADDPHAWTVTNVTTRATVGFRADQRALVSSLSGGTAFFDSAVTESGDALWRDDDVWTADGPEPIWVLTRDGEPVVLLDTRGFAAVPEGVHVLPELWNACGADQSAVAVALLGDLVR